MACPEIAWLVLAITVIAGAGGVIGVAAGAALIATVFAAVYHAEVVAHRIGEPFGTLVLAVAVTVIEVALIVSVMVAVPADKEGLAFAREGFCDRLYRDDGSLTPRSEKGAVIDDPEAAAKQALRLAREGEAVTATGARIKLEADTLCIHGDEPAAVMVAAAVCRALERAGIELCPLMASSRR